MKRFLLIIFTPFVFHAVQAQTPRVDSLAVYVLNRMSFTIQNLSSCSFVTQTDYDVWLDEVGYIKHATTDKVYMKFPDKIKVNLWGDKGHRSLFFNGNRFSYYSFSNNQYSEIEIKGTIVEAVDTVNKSYGIEFPAADFFYPSFLDDLLDTGGNLVYLGISNVNDKPCYHIAGNDVDGTVFQFWISQNDYFLPMKMVLTYKTDAGFPQYEAEYTEWEINPSIPDAMFEFILPPGAKPVKMNLVK